MFRQSEGAFGYCTCEIYGLGGPTIDQRTLACPCGDQARYLQLRSKTILTVVGNLKVSRPYYLCPKCHCGQFPVDAELDIAGTEFSPGVRRMQATVGQHAPFDQGRKQMKDLAGLEVPPNPSNAMPRPLERISLHVSNARSAKRFNWIFR